MKIVDIDAALNHLRLDPVMAEFIDVHPRPTYEKTSNAFHTIVRSIVGQQLSGKVAEIIHGRFLALWPEIEHPAPTDLLTVTHEQLRGVGLSGAKARSLVDLAEKIEAGELHLASLDSMDDEEIKTELVKVKGIGPWSADMFLMFGLARPDILPLGDLAIRNGMLRVMNLEKALPEQMEARAEMWRPYRTVACWYLWRSS